MTGDGNRCCYEMSSSQLPWNRDSVFLVIDGVGPVYKYSRISVPFVRSYLNPVNLPLGLAVTSKLQDLADECLRGLSNAQVRRFPQRVERP